MCAGTPDIHPGGWVNILREWHRCANRLFKFRSEKERQTEMDWYLFVYIGRRNWIDHNWSDCKLEAPRENLQLTKCPFWSHPLWINLTFYLFEHSHFIYSTQLISFIIRQSEKYFLTSLKPTPAMVILFPKCDDVISSTSFSVRWKLVGSAGAAGFSTPPLHTLS